MEHGVSAKRQGTLRSDFLPQESSSDRLPLRLPQKGAEVPTFKEKSDGKPNDL